MMDNKIEKKILQIKEQLRKYEYEYYVLSSPSVTDMEYDSLLKELMLLENKYPQYLTDDSPSQRVGGIISKNFVKVKHLTPMLSLSNAFNDKDLLHFDETIRKITNDKKIGYVVEPKIDGLSISLLYENGVLKQAITRGDGFEGEDVTNNAKTIKSIPLLISEKKKIIVRGEVFFKKDDFHKINDNELNKVFSNPRNAASGTMRNLDSSIVAKRHLSVILYQIPNANDFGLKTQFDVLKKLQEWKFPVSTKVNRLFDDIFSVISYVNEYFKKQEDLDYIIDGMVVKLNQLDYYGDIGYTSKFPKWAIAYKFPANICVTKLLKIFITIGRTGKVTYVAKLEPVDIDGTIVSSAILHNYDYIEKNDIRENDYVRVCKAGEIIPKILSPVIEKRSKNLNKFSPIKFCPVCSSELKQSAGEVDYFCISIDCPARLQQSLIHFCSKKAMNIEGIAENIIDKFYKSNFLRSIEDIYLLENHKDQILKSDLKIKEKLWNKLFLSIEKSKNNSLERLIFGLGILHVGENSAKILAKKFLDLNSLMNADIEELINIPDIGEKTAISIINFFSVKKNIELINSLKNSGVNTKYIGPNIDVQENSSEFYQKIFLITGSFSIPRDEIKIKMEKKYDAKFVSSFSKKIDYLLVGQKPTQSKINLAQSQGIKIIYEEIW